MRCARSAASIDAAIRASSSAARGRSGPRTWRSSSTPRAPPASPRARCTCTAGSCYSHARGQHDRGAGRSRRAHVLPAAVPRRRAHWSASTSPCTPAPMLNFVENPDTVPENVREIAPTVFTAVPRVWEKFYSAVTIARARGVAAAAAAYALGASASATQVADLVLARQPVPRVAEGAASCSARWLALDNVRKLIGIHRARFLRHRRGADLARPDPLVPGARRADARGLGHDRDRRRSSTVDAGRRASSRASIGTAAPFNEVRIDAGTGETPGARPQRLHGLPEPAARRPPRRSTPTAGCTPATSARSTTTATSASPTA